MARCVESGEINKKAYESFTTVACGTKCPVTGGHPIRITEPAWKKICEAKQRSGIPSSSGRELYGRFSGEKYTACKRCKGKRTPKEVEFIGAEEVAMIGGR